MSPHLPGRGVARFCAKFFLYASLCLIALWWLILPYYVAALGQCAGGILKYALGRPIESIDVHVAGLLNTDTELVIGAAGRTSPIAVTALVTNLATYAALILATGGLSWVRRARVLTIGVVLLAASHVLYIVLTFHFAAAIAGAIELPMALAQFFIMAPFLLWIALAYWEQIGAGSSGAQNSESANGS